MPAEDDISIEEKRVYAGSAGRTDVFVASGLGLVRVALSGDKIGEFTMVSRGTVRDVAVSPRRDAPDRIAVATDEDLRVGNLTTGDDHVAGDELDLTDAGVGPAAAVDDHNSGFLVAGEDGAVSVVGAGGDERRIDRIGNVDDPRAVDAPLVAAADGVHRVVGDDPDAASLSNVGLADVRDVAGAGVPLAATADGLYYLGNGWMDARPEAAAVVAADGEGHALASTEAGFYRHAGDAWGPDSWALAALPVDERVVAAGYGPGVALAVTEAGTLCVDAGDGWRHQVIGARDVEGIAATRVD
ncbi:HVO_0234 family beta-propeller protein [Haloparvum sp. PAK95]|uniref:HVO_0234 family beta-propeller protein n=1 Tax=Haloparvum sp. PAK95 TaxID=3418962 RepID=UPI003D2EEDAC